MSGHSKWSTIKHKKGKEDAKRGKAFAKLSRYITVAAKKGGDPDYNPDLKLAIDRAKSENMPNDNIERAIKKGTGEGDSANYEEVTFEGYGPAGIAVIVTTLTDNRNRTVPNVRHAFDKNNGNLGTTGSVTFMFNHAGTIIIEKTDDIDEDELTMAALDLGADDVVLNEDSYEVITSVENYLDVKNGLEENYTIAYSEIGYVPQNYQKLDNPEDIKLMERMLDMLEEDDDVQDVYHNWEEEE